MVICLMLEASRTASVARILSVIDIISIPLAAIRATAPPGWQKDEDELWRALAENSAPMLRLLEDKTPLRFELVNHPDFYVEAPGGKIFGRMVSPTVISKFLLGRLWNKVRPSVKPQYFTYKEMIGGILKDPWKAGLRMGHRLVWRFLMQKVGLGNGLIVGLLRGCLDHGCRIFTDADVKQLLVDGGVVTGVESVIAGKPCSIRARKGVVLATGGFDWAPDYMPRHFPGIELIGAPRDNTGDGQRMAEAAGFPAVREIASLEEIDAYRAEIRSIGGGPRYATIRIAPGNPPRALPNRDGVFLGLAIASELALRMGGRLLLDQAEGRKAFRLELAADHGG